MSSGETQTPRSELYVSQNIADLGDNRRTGRHRWALVPTEPLCRQNRRSFQVRCDLETRRRQPSSSNPSFARQPIVEQGRRDPHHPYKITPCARSLQATGTITSPKAGGRRPEPVRHGPLRRDFGMGRPTDGQSIRRERGFARDSISLYPEGLGLSPFASRRRGLGPACPGRYPCLRAKRFRVSRTARGFDPIGQSTVPRGPFVDKP